MREEGVCCAMEMGSGAVFKELGIRNQELGILKLIKAVKLKRQARILL